MKAKSRSAVRSKDIYDKIIDVVGDENIGIAFNLDNFGEIIRCSIDDSFSDIMTREVNFPGELSPFIGKAVGVNFNKSKVLCCDDLTPIMGTDPVPGIIIQDLIVEIEVRISSATSPQEYWRRWEIGLSRVEGAIKLVDGFIRIELQNNPTLKSFNTNEPDGNTSTTRPIKNKLINILVNDYYWTLEKIERFEKFLEGSFVSIASINGISGIVNSLHLYNIQDLFPSFKFKGEAKFILEEVTVNNDRVELLILKPSNGIEVEKELECTAKMIRQTLKTPSWIDGNNSKSTTRITRTRIIPSPAEVYEGWRYEDFDNLLFLTFPEKVSNRLFNPVEILKARANLFSTNGEINLFGFVVSYLMSSVFQSLISLNWKLFGPAIVAQIKLKTLAKLGVYLKIGCVTSHVADISCYKEYKVKFESILMEANNSYCANLGFFGELVDPTNLNLEWDVKTALGGIFDRIVLWLLNNVAEPIIQILFSYIMANVTWPLLGGAIPTGSMVGRSLLCNVVSDYYSDGFGALIGIGTRDVGIEQ